VVGDKQNGIILQKQSGINIHKKAGTTGLFDFNHIDEYVLSYG
jgi:hypothetical protein